MSARLSTNGSGSESERRTVRASVRRLLFAPVGVFATLGLVACGGSNAASGARTSAAPAMAPSGPREQTADQQVSHVLSRLAFGARPGDAQRVRELGVDRWIDLQLHPERIDDSATEQFLHENYKLLDVDAAELQRLVPPPGVLQQQLAARSKERTLTAADSADAVPVPATLRARTRNR